jgi:hypothetical protein
MADMPDTAASRKRQIRVTPRPFGGAVIPSRLSKTILRPADLIRGNFFDALRWLAGVLHGSCAVAIKLGCQVEIA